MKSYHASYIKAKETRLWVKHLYPALLTISCKRAFIAHKCVCVFIYETAAREDIFVKKL